MSFEEDKFLLCDRIVRRLEDDVKIQILISHCSPNAIVNYLIDIVHRDLRMDPCKAMWNLIETLVNYEIEHSLKERIEEISDWENRKRFPNENNPYDNSERVHILREKYSRDPEFYEGDNSETEVTEVDETISVGGNTLLHVAVKNGNLEMVVNLVSVQNARTDLKNNAGFTSMDLARALGEQEIVEFLEKNGH